MSTDELRPLRVTRLNQWQWQAGEITTSFIVRVIDYFFKCIESLEMIFIDRVVELLHTCAQGIHSLSF